MREAKRRLFLEFVEVLAIPFHLERNGYLLHQALSARLCRETGDSMKFKRPGGASPDLGLIAAVGAVGSLAAAAALVSGSAQIAERANPPSGRFVHTRGVKLHYLERGAGPPVVLLHGNGVSALDWAVSGVLDGLAVDHRVIAFDRPGFGYSERPRDKTWTPLEQAELLHAALMQLGVERP